VRSLGVMMVAIAAAGWLAAARFPLPETAAKVTETGAPAAPAGETGWHRVEIAAGPDGHFVLDAAVEGVPVTFLVDSGATAVVLSSDAARRLGLVGGRLRFTHKVTTANGVVRAAPVRLRELRIGQLALRDVEAAVLETPLQTSLLGMSFLRRLDRWEVRDGRLALYW
jgi:aspartyl protease family protein